MNDRIALALELLKALDADQSEPTPERKKPELPRMRTIPAAVAAIKAEDPESALTVTALRRAVKCGQIPAVDVCTKKLVNLADVYKFMSGSSVPSKAESVCGIRRVNR